MTKHVRIENADTSNYKVMVQLWDKGFPAGADDVLVKEFPLDHPTAMTPSDLYLTSTRYIIIKEYL